MIVAMNMVMIMETEVTIDHFIIDDDYDNACDHWQPGGGGRDDSGGGGSGDNDSDGVNALVIIIDNCWWWLWRCRWSITIDNWLF